MSVPARFGCVYVLEALEERVIHRLVVPNTLRVEIRRNTSGAQGQDFNVRFAELVAEGVGEGLLARLVGVVYRLARERGHF